MKCLFCGEIYNEEMSPHCPFCLSKNDGLGDGELDLDDCCCKADAEGEEESKDSAASSNTPESMFEERQDIEEDKPKINDDKYSSFDIDNVNIADIDSLSTRAKNVLYRSGIFKFGELKAYAQNHDLSGLKNLGEKTCKEITNILNTFTREKFEFEKQAKSYENLKIEDVFSKIKYNIFLEYCQIKGFKYIGDLSNLNYEDLLKFKGMGENKVLGIIKKYGYILEKDGSLSAMDSFNGKTYFNLMDPYLGNEKVNYLCNLDINTKSVKNLMLHGFITINDLRGISENALVCTVGGKDLITIKKIDQLLSLPLKKLVFQVLTKKAEKDNLEYLKDRAEGFTLQEIGTCRGLTRERVRQIVEKHKKWIIQLIAPVLNSLLAEKRYITTQQLMTLFEDADYNKMILYCCKNTECLTYLDFAEVFVLSNNNENIVEKIAAISKEFVGECINLYDSLEELEYVMDKNGFPYMDGVALINLLKQYNYHIYGNYIVKEKQSYGYLGAKIVADKFPRGIKLYDGEDLDSLREYIKQECGEINMAESNRSFSSRISSYLVLSGRGMFMAPENIKIDLSILEQIKEFIDRSESTHIYYSEIFSRFEGVLKMFSNVDNYNFLHGVLKLYYPNDYDFSSRDYLVRKDGVANTQKINDRIRNYIIKVNRPISKFEVRKELPGITDIVLAGILTSDASLIQWDYNYWCCMDILDIDNDAKQYLYNSITEIMRQNNGYCSENMLYDFVRPELNDFLNKNRIYASINLFYICGNLFGNEFVFKKPHIVAKGKFENLSVKNVALHLLNYPDETSFSEYQSVAQKLKWSNVTTGIVFSDIEQDYIRISRDCYIKKIQFCIDDKKIKSIEDFIRTNMKHGIFSLITFSDFDRLPEVSYSWNIYLLRSFVDNYISEFKVIEPKTKDRRYERGLVVEKDAEFNDYVDVVVHLMKNNNYKEISESKMLSLLLINDLTYQLIPKELYCSDKLTFKNEMFIID